MFTGNRWLEDVFPTEIVPFERTFVCFRGRCITFFLEYRKNFNLSNMSQVTFAFFSCWSHPSRSEKLEARLQHLSAGVGEAWGGLGVVGVRILGLQQKAKPLVWMCPLEVREWSWMKYNFCEDWFLVVFIFCLCRFSCSGCQIKDSVYYRRCDRHPWGTYLESLVLGVTSLVLLHHAILRFWWPAWMSFFGWFFRKVCDSIVSRYDYIKFVNNESQLLTDSQKRWSTVALGSKQQAWRDDLTRFLGNGYTLQIIYHSKIRLIIEYKMPCSYALPPLTITF